MAVVELGSQMLDVGYEKNPVTGQVGHRYLVLDQSMIMAALDAALAGGLHRRFQRDPVIRAARPYLAAERFSIS